ncbi:MAG: type II secretion system F family protein [Planctomycetota bacterium]
MPIYTYKARDDSGRIVEGALNVPDKKTAALKLAEIGLFTSEIVEQKEKPLSLNQWFGPKVNPDELIIFNRQLATMLRAGLTLTTSFNILIQQTENKLFRKVLSKIFTDISAGTTLAEAISKYPTVFSDLYINAVRVGEETGQLNEVLDNTADFLQRRSELIAKITASLTYPAVIVALAILVILLMLIFVMPSFKKLFADARVILPLPTRMILFTSDLITSYWYLILAGLILTAVTVIILASTRSGRFVIDRWKLNLPLVGPLFRRAAILRFAGSFEILIRSGVDIILACEIVKKSVGNVILEKVMEDVRINVQKGGRLYEPLKNSGEFPPMVVQMVAIGEETGSLDKMLRVISETYQHQLEHASKRLVTLIEPILLTGLAVVIAILALAVYLPIWKMMEVLS